MSSAPSSPPPIPLDEARHLLLDRLVPLPPQTVLLAHALGRAAAERVVATCLVPPVRNSAMDGYVLPNDGSRPDGYLLLEPDHPDPARIDGRTRRVLTGQPVPDWAWCVAAEEHCRRRGQVVFPRGRWPAGHNIREAGEDTRPGDVVAEVGTRLDAPLLARLASVGRHRLRVGRPPRVLVLSTGNELVRPPTRPRADWQRHECNTHLLTALLRQAGARVDPLPHLPDRGEVVRRMLERLPPWDLLITIGGASNSEADLSRPTLRELGVRFLFERVHLKPGRPTAFGLWHDRPVLCLPGNPVAAFVTAVLFALPAVRRLAGFADPLATPPWIVDVQSEVLPDRQRFQVLAVRLSPGPQGLPLATPFPESGSGILRSLTTCDGLIGIPPDTHIQPGTRLPLLWVRHQG